MHTLLLVVLSAVAAPPASASPCAEVREIRLDRPKLAQGDVALAFFSKTYESVGLHAAWKLLKDERRFGTRPGGLDGSVEKPLFRALVAAVNTPEFFALQPVYAGAGGDAAMLTVTCEDGRSKSVTVFGAAAPAAFQSAADAMLKLAASIFWVS